MTTDFHRPVLAIVIGGQELAADNDALMALRSRHPGLRLLAFCLEGGEPGSLNRYDRVIQLPLQMQHRLHAEALALQICLNEAADAAGIIRSLRREELAAASHCLDALRFGQTDVVIAGPDDRDTHLFVSARAAFLASSWAALGGKLLPDRLRVAAGLLALARRRGARFVRGSGFFGLPAVDLASLAPRADDLRRALGLLIGSPAPVRAGRVDRVAVVLPYHRESDRILARAVASVRSQSRPADLIMVSDGFPNAIARAPDITHVELGVAHSDNGNTPRYTGAMVALARGYDAVAFLDADNWFDDKHLERLVARQNETGAGVVFSLRNIYLPDGYKLPGIEGKDAQRKHADTSCYLITRDCEFALHLWGQMPQEWGPICDRVVFRELGGQSLAWTANRTLNFESNYAAHYEQANRPIPQNVHYVPDRLLRAFSEKSPAFRELSLSRLGRVSQLSIN